MEKEENNSSTEEQETNNEEKITTKMPSQVSPDLSNKKDNFTSDFTKHPEKTDEVSTQQDVTTENKTKPFSIPVEPDKYDKQVLTLKNLGYSEQQILDNLLRLNPELHEKKHVAAQAVGKYFERKQVIPEPSSAPVMMGGMELTEEMKEFIDGSLRKQIDAFRNIIKEERERRLSFLDALSVKTLEWAPLLLFIQVIFTVTFLLYKGGIDCIGVIFYGPSVPSQMISFAILFLLAGLLVIMVFLKDHIYDEKALDKFKVAIYLVLFPLILSVQIMALDRYRNEVTWQDFTTINNKEYFLKKWYETDYRDRTAFLNRSRAFIVSPYTIPSEITDAVRPLVYLEVRLFNLDLPDQKLIAIYKSILLYDPSPVNRENALESLQEILTVQKTVMNNMDNRISAIKKNIEEKASIKSNERFYIVDNIIGKIRINANEKLVNITNILKQVVRNDNDLNVRLKAINVLKSLNLNRLLLEDLISQEKDPSVYKAIEDEINK